MAKQKYLVFSLKNEYYGIEIGAVKEIIAMQKITPVPKTEMSIQGIVNLRGTIISILDLRTKLDIERIDYNERTIIIVIELTNEKSKKKIGIAVDSVSEVEDISDEQIEEVKEDDIDMETKYIKSVGKLEDKVALLLDIEKVLSRNKKN